MSKDRAESRRESPWWTSFLERAREPAFLLDHNRRLRYVNPAWEQLTGCSSAEIAGLTCTRRKSSRAGAVESQLTRALAPPDGVLQGDFECVRRAVPPDDSGPPWWEVTFLPFHQEEGLLGILGIISVIGASQPVPRTEKLGEAWIAPSDDMAADYHFGLLESPLPAMQRVLAQARVAARIQEPVWLSGPRGVGKATVARMIHHRGTNAGLAFVGVDCLGLPQAVVRAMLFGRAALSRSKRVGTLFLRHPTRLPRDVQQEIIEWITERKPDRPRIIVATEQSPAQTADSDQLSADWLAQLAVLEIPIPPLSQRREDIPALAQRLIERIGRAGGSAPIELEPRLYELLAKYDWPGNGWELESILRGMALNAGEGPVGVDQLPRWLRERVGEALVPEIAPPSFLNLDLTLEQVERRLILLALKQSNFNQTEAAERLGIWRARLARRIEALNIEIPAKKGKKNSSDEET